MTRKIGIIAGGGDLPRQLCEACETQGRPYYVVALEGHADEAALTGRPHSTVRVGAVGKALAVLKSQEIREIIIAGGLARPSMVELRPDAEAMRFFAKVGASALGDDGLLSSVVRYLEDEHGFTVLNADVVLGRVGLPAGVATSIEPDEQADADIARGVSVLRALSPVDVGQAVVVQQGLVLGIEAIEGTDALIARCAALQREGPGGVLVKIPKTDQESRVDQPTIGVATVTGSADAGLRGIAIEAETTIVVDAEATVAAAEDRGLFLVALSR